MTMCQGETATDVARARIHPVPLFGRPGSRTRSQPPAERPSSGSTVLTPVIGRVAATGVSRVAPEFGAELTGWEASRVTSSWLGGMRDAASALALEALVSATSTAT